MRFSDIEWGSDEAKGDSNLNKYFFEFSKFSNILTGKYRYIIGRKGTGKTAIIEKIKNITDDNPLGFYSNLTLRDFPLRDLKDLRDKSYQDKSQFVSIWQFLIYIELVKLLLKDESIANEDKIKELKEFLEINNLNNNLGFINTIKELKQSNSKIKVFLSWISGELNTSNSCEQITTIHYHNVVKTIEKKLKMQSECEYWIFIDELDEGYKAGDTNLRLLLLALLRAVENCALALNNSIKFRPLLVLRSDIFDSLEDNDLNKLDDYTIRLKWTSEDISKTNDLSDIYTLKEVISARIKSSLPSCNNKNPWQDVVEETDPNLPEKTTSTWKYMANRTYERPRDIVKFLKYCSETFNSDDKYQNKLTFKEIQRAEDRYSNWLHNELRDEIQAYLPCWKEVFQCLTAIGTGRFQKQNLDKQLIENRTISNWLGNNNKETNDIIELLFDFGILGTLDGKRWLFKYKDEDLSWNENMDLIIHFGLHRKLRIKNTNHR